MKATIKTLLDTGNKAIMKFTKKDLFGEEVNIEHLWALPQVKKILRRQQPNGSWVYPNKRRRSSRRTKRRSSRFKELREDWYSFWQ